MASMGKYCKAYHVKQLRAFDHWDENLANLRTDRPDIEAGQPPGKLRDDDFLFLQENFIVTDGIFKDQHIIFDKVTPEWKHYCVHTLNFEIPSFAATRTSVQPHPID